MSISLLTDRPTFTTRPDTVVRKQIDRSLSRALFDGDYAARLLMDPTIALEQSGCQPQQFKTLRSIQASDLVDFARQAHALFWTVEPGSSYPEDHPSLAAAAAH